MKEYERLTIRNNGVIDTNCRNCKQCEKAGRKFICNDMTACNEEIITRLAELEDKIERGELVENKVVTYINMGRSGGKTLIDKALKYDELKAKIENGTLIELPCKVGTVIYYIVGITTRKILKQKVDYYITETPFYIDILESYQNNWFLTKAEAEKRLKELKGE